MAAAAHAPAISLQQQPPKEKNLPLVHKLVGGGAAGVVGTTAIFPIGRSVSGVCFECSLCIGGCSGRVWLLDADIDKMRAQTSSKMHKSQAHAAPMIFAKEGKTAVYKGGVP